MKSSSKGLYKRGNVYWVQFMVNGKRYQESTGKTVEREALNWKKTRVDEIKSETNATKIYEKIKSHLAQNKATFQEAFNFFRDYPRKHSASAKVINQRKTYWFDFAAFAIDNGVSLASDVDSELAMRYLAHFRAHGRYSSTTAVRNGKSVIIQSKEIKLSSTTCNRCLESIKLIYSILQKGKYCVENPFSDFEKMARDQVNRDIFTPAELIELGKHQDNDVYPILAVGCFTGLRLVDICHIKWGFVNFQRNWISGIQHKTNNPYDLPLLPPLRKFLEEYSPDKPADQYIFPGLAEQYDKDASKISRKFKNLLEEAGIEGATVLEEGRSRASSKKDIHSVRHTFAYILGMSNVPQPVAQAVLGHMTPAMTRHYMAHANEEDKRRYLKAIPNLLALPTDDVAPRNDRERIRRLIEKATPENITTLKRRLLKIL